MEVKGNQPQTEEDIRLWFEPDPIPLQQVFKLERNFTFLKTGKVQQQIVYGFTSLSRERIAPAIAPHHPLLLGIENGLHCRRDVTLREDPTRISKLNAARLMTCLNNLRSKVD